MPIFPPRYSRGQHQSARLHHVQKFCIFATHGLDLNVYAELQHVHDESGGQLHLRAVLEEHERGPEPELEHLLERRDEQKSGRQSDQRDCTGLISPA